MQNPNWLNQCLQCFLVLGLLQVELLKEMENTVFYPSMKELSKTLYDEAGKKLAASQADEDKRKWMAVRNYFAVGFRHKGVALGLQHIFQGSVVFNNAVVYHGKISCAVGVGMRIDVVW